MENERIKTETISAKQRLKAVADKALQDAFDAKARGEKIGWCSSNFPVEIPETLGLCVVYPETQAAGIAARGGGERMCRQAEADGYSNDICAYARISLAYAKGNRSAEQDLPAPDFLLCCNNICNCVMKWYENLAQDLKIPLIFIDVPFNPDYTVSEAEIDYIADQFADAVKQLEEITGKKWDEDRFREVMGISVRCSRAWLDATACARYQPSPFNGFDLFNHMAVMVTARGKKEAAEAMETLLSEYEQNHAKGISTFKGEEKHRIMLEGIACFPYLRFTSSTLRDRGINVVSTVYVDTFGYVYKGFRDLCRAYVEITNCYSLEVGRDRRIKLFRNNGIDGLLVHTNRSCKLWSGFMPELARQIGADRNVPVVFFDGDQADPRNFSEAQYATRVQGLAEIMSTRKEMKGDET